MGLTVESASYRYDTGGPTAVPAVERVSLAVEPGRLVLVVGETGSGKSTLLRMLAGLLAPSTGSATLDSEPLSRRTARGTIGLVFQDPESQLFAESVLQDVAFGPANLGLDPAQSRDRAIEALDRVGLDAGVFGPRSPFRLSGGEARRAAIAGVLAMRPRYLLFDEPTAGLDACGRRAVRAIINAERSRSGVVVVSHSAEEFFDQADEIVMLVAGSVAFHGSRDDVLADTGVFTRVGLVAPDLLQLVEIGRSRGAPLRPASLDPEVVAEAIARSGGWE